VTSAAALISVGCVAAIVASGCGGSSKLTGITPGSPEATGHALFISAGCMQCQSINGEGGSLGPDLTHVGTLNKTSTYTGALPVSVSGVSGPVYRGKDWFVLHTECPTCATPGSAMPSFASFTAQQYLALAGFLSGLGVTEK
jgi:cbb3-type cytochrome oxidase cytochrome c subunit